MSAVSELIDVSYKDMTNYPEDYGGDVLGIPFNHHWGPVGRLDVLSESRFYEKYPESLPFTGSPSISDYYAYAQIKKAYESGIGSVEAFRVQGSWKYKRLALNPVGTTTAPTVMDATTAYEINNAPLYIATKYPGIPPKSLVGDYKNLILRVSCHNNNVNIVLFGAGDADETIAGGTSITIASHTYSVFQIEAFEGSNNATQIEDGMSYFLPNVLSNSDFLQAYASGDPIADLEQKDYLLTFTVPNSFTYQPTDLDAFGDTMLSQATLLISPLPTDALDSKVGNIANERQDMVGVIGYPTASVFSYDQIDTYFTSKSGLRAMFTNFIAGREITKVFGYNILLNCTGGWCGRCAAIAKKVNTNQLPSAFTYGGYNGSLDKTLSFDEVCALHKKGIISVYSSVNGPQIFGVRSSYPKGTSYFGKANVMRVLAEILRQVFPICLNAIHTDAAANPTTRSMYNNTFNNIINDEIAKENLINDSYANCLGDINSDAKTKGGEIFNLVLSLHFIKLVESIKIAVIATDSSVTAEIIS